MTTRGNGRKARVWDAPVRVVHWLIVASVIAAWLTREASLVDLHAAAGYCVLGLAAFRVAWGFAGTRHARFRDFTYSPRAALRYLAALARRSAPTYTGHNPAGSWSVFVLIALELGVTVSGIVAIAGMHGLGPLAGHVAFATADAALATHEAIAWTMLVVIALHVLGVVASSLAHRENLATAMVTGRKDVASQESPIAAHRITAAALAVACVVLVVGYLAQARERPARVASPAAVVPAAWREECGSCHLAYAPCLLPQDSWRAMLAQAKHFGEELALSPRQLTALESIAATPERVDTWACWKTRASTGSRIYQKVTDTPYWKHAHHRLDAAAFKPPRSAGRHDCAACHDDAEPSIFHPRMIHLPQ